MKYKLAFYVLSVTYLVLFVFLGLSLFVFNNGKIENNIVKIVKEAEIIHNYENNLDETINNPSENVFTGFFINEYTIITVAHGINKENSIYTIYDFEGNEYKAFLKEKDNENDIAYLEINKKYENYSKVRYAKELEEGEEVKSIRYDGTIKKGIAQKIENNKISSSIIFEDGDSGSPLLNHKNRIIGINIEVDIATQKGISLYLKNNN